MFIKRLPLFLKVQLAFLLVVAAVLAVGDRSQPKIGSLPDTLTVGQPLIVPFDRPMNRETVERGFSLKVGDVAVPGAFSWSSRSVAFIPEVPLRNGVSYTLSLEGIEDREGHVLRKPYAKELRTLSARFVYLTPELNVALYDVDGEVSTPLSAANEKVLDYAVSADGRQVLVAYQNREDETAYGLYSLRLDETGGSGKTVLYEGKDRMYDRVLLCGPDSTAVVSRNAIDGEGLIGETALVSFPLNGKRADFNRPTFLLPGEEIPAMDTLFCSAVSEQIIYHSKTGNTVLGSLFEPSGEPIGSYMYNYGFSSQGSTLLLGDTADDQDLANEAIYAINDLGIRETLSDTAVDSSHPAYDPQDRVLALSEDVPSVGDPNDYFIHFKIALRQKDRGTVLVRSLTEGMEGYSDKYPQWSADGRYLSFERIRQDIGFSRNRDRDSRGNLIDGEIWLAEFGDEAPLLGREIRTRRLLIKGAGVRWLP